MIMSTGLLRDTTLDMQVRGWIEAVKVYQGKEKDMGKKETDKYRFVKPETVKKRIYSRCAPYGGIDVLSLNPENDKIGFIGSNGMQSVSLRELGYKKDHGGDYRLHIK